jgi:hypothetical protein
MDSTIDLTAWSATLLGLFAIAVAVGALRQPGLWLKMIDEVEHSPALQLLSGFMELFVGAAIYLVNPWVPGDLLSMVMKAVGGLMMLEALVVMAICDLYMQMWLKNLAAVHRFWTATTLVLGIVLTIAGTMRFG